MTWTPKQLLESGKYKVVKQLGQGGFSQVYLVKDIYLNKYVAIKRPHSLFKNDRSHSDFLQRFQREGYILSKISIPNIVKVISFTDIDEVPCLIMEFIEGETLWEYVQRHGYIPEEEALKMFRDLAISLQSLHEQKVIHCDIHPENIIIRPNGVPTLIDFGSAKFIHPKSWTVSSTKNDFYSSYEQLIEEDNEFNLQPNWDIYGLAATMFFAVTGQKPEKAISRMLYGDSLTDPEKLRPDLSDRLNRFILKGMALESADRPSSIQEWLNSVKPSDIPSGQAATEVAVNVLKTYNIFQDTKINTRNNPLKTLILGVFLGGVLIASNLVLGRNSIDYSSYKKSSPADTKNLDLANINSSLITRESAIQLLSRWLTYKKFLFAMPYNKSQGSSILTGKAYQNEIANSPGNCPDKDPDYCLSTIDWLKKYNARYSYEFQRVDSIDLFKASGNTGTIIAKITEFRTLHISKRTISSGGTKQVKYDLKFDDGKVKISDYKILN